MRFERELLKGIAPVLVMELLSRKAMYGYELSAALHRRSGEVFSLGRGTLYPLLYNLEGKGWVTGQREEAPLGRVRKYYSLTAKGKTELARRRKELEELQRGLSAVFQPTFSPA